MVKLTLDKKLRSENKTVYWLAKKTGINWESLSNINENKVISVRLETLDKICEAFNCELHEIIERI